MIKKIITAVLLIAFAIHTFNRVVIVFGFYANQTVIAATLCENKDKPLLKCEGKCLLAKKLKAQDKKEEQNPERKAENRPEDLSSRSFYSTLSITGLPEGHDWENSRNSGKPIHRSFILFHPPISPVHIS